MSTGQSLNEVISGLTLVLEREKEALLGGAYQTVAQLLSEKERLGAILDSILLDPGMATQLPAFRKKLQGLASAAKDNERLLAAAKGGANLAQVRIKNILNSQQMVGVYGEAGEKVLAPDAGVSRQKFA